MHITALVEVLDWARPVGQHRWGSANMEVSPRNHNKEVL